MKFTLLLMLLSGPALAGGGSFFGPGGGGGSSSTGTLVDGADASLRNVTVQTLTSTGTAPSLTATGAVFTGSVTVLGTNGLAVGASQAIERAKQASDYLLIGHPTSAGANRSNIRYTGAGYFSSPSLANAESDGDKLVFYNGANGKTAMGLGDAYDLWLQATGPGAGGGSIAFWTGATGTASKNMTLDSSGNLGIGTASPNAKLDVTGAAMFGTGGTQSTFTATGFFQPYSRTTLQLSLLAPSAVGQYIDNSTLGALCRSTGTSAGNWALATAAGTGCF